MGFPNPAAWAFDIDKWLNPFIPSPPWKWLPYPISYFFGYRKQRIKPIGNLLMIAWAFVGIFLGIIVIELVTKQVAVFQDHQAPVIIASFGAASVLHFYSIESPLAQPRNGFFAQVIASVVGVAVCKLFALSPHFQSIRWLGGALACAIATALMAITKTVHPPAGATALLAVVSDDSLALGWWLVPTMMLGATLMLTVALVINNIQRQYPQYWWTPEDLSAGGREQVSKSKSEKALDVDLEKSSIWASASQREESSLDQPQIILRKGGRVIVPSELYLTPEEMTLLEELSNRL